MSIFASDEHDDEMMSEINMIPFIDVMLVLLIIFIITVPVMKHAVNIELPEGETEKAVIDPDTVNLSIKADGSYWLGNDDPVSDEELLLRLTAEAEKEPRPEVHIYGHHDVRYERVTQAMTMATQVGLQKIGFLMEPPAKAN